MSTKKVQNSQFRVLILADSPVSWKATPTWATKRWWTTNHTPSPSSGASPTPTPPGTNSTSLMMTPQSLRTMIEAPPMKWWEFHVQSVACICFEYQLGLMASNGKGIIVEVGNWLLDYDHRFMEPRTKPIHIQTLVYINYGDAKQFLFF